MDTRNPIVVIAGPTASGKTELAINLAQKFRGEIICADSRTIYREMNVGTAKPSDEQRSLVPHHGLDLVDPNEQYSAGQFKIYASEKIAEIQIRNKIAFIVGGSGLYVDGLVYDFGFADKPKESLRKHLSGMGLPQLQQKAKSLGIRKDQVNYSNHRHLARVVERGGITPTKASIPKNVLFLGVSAPKDVLNKRIESRVEKMLGSGLEEETMILLDKYGKDAPGLLAPGYKAMTEYISGAIGIEQAKLFFEKADKSLAKRQMTWFKRNKDIKWVNSKAEAEQLLQNFLSKFDTIDL